jgi:6-phosphogluconate dehydrogenase
MKIGIVGLGAPGARFVARGLSRGLSMVGFDKGGLPRALMASALEEAPALEALTAALETPRLVLLCTEPGALADEAFLGLRRHLSDGDVVLDATASHWRDSVRRYRSLRARGLRLLDLGVSGQDDGAWSVMVGGDLDAYAAVASLVERLAEPGKAAYVGPPGAGHFAAHLCGALEGAMRRTLAEGLSLLEASDYRFDLSALLSLWQGGSALSGAVVERQARGLSGDEAPSKGAPPWIVEHALERGVPVPLLSVARCEALRAAAAPAPAARPSPSPL